MKWWFSRKPKPAAIPTYPLPPIVPQPKPEPGITVEEHDVSQMTRTGIFRAFDRLAGKFKD